MTDSIHFAGLAVRHRLGVDPLGHSLIADDADLGDGSTRPVLVRAFHGRGIDSEALWRAAGEHADKVRVSPGAAAAATLGRDAGIPYLAYPGLTGRDLAAVLAAARERDLPLAADQALTVISELAHGAARVPLVHGLIVPHLVVIDDAGGVHLLGFEVGPALATQCAGGRLGAALAPYLSPELRAGAAAGPADDVYAVAALFAELLSGRTPEADLAAGLARLELVDGEPLPAGWLDLLERSVAPRGERIPDLESWTRELERLLFDHYYQAAPRSLATLAARLFEEPPSSHRPPEPADAPAADEADEGADALWDDDEAISTGPATPPPAAAGVAPSSPGAEAGTEAKAGTANLVEDGTPRTDPTPEAEAASEPAPQTAAGWPRRAWFAAAAAAVALIAAGGYFVLEPGFAPGASPPATPAGQGQGPGTVERDPTRARPRVEPAATTPENAPEPPPAASDRPSPLRQRTERTDSAAPAPAPATGGGPEPDAPGGPSPAPVIERLDLEPRPSPARPADSTANGTSEPGQGAPTAPAAARKRPESGGEPERPAGPPPPEAEGGSERPAESPAPDAAASEPVMPQLDLPEVWVGELVEPGPGVTAPRLRRMPSPQLPLVARGEVSAPNVEVRVLVSEEGEPLTVALGGQRIGHGVDAEALRVIRESTFEPATKDGVRVRMWTTVTVRFPE